MPDRPVVTLDLDDTLWDAGPTLEAAEQALFDWLAAHCPRLAARHSPQTLADHRRALALAQPDIAHDLTELRRVSLQALALEVGYDASIAETALAIFLQARQEVELYADVLPVLEALRHHYRLVALTNGNADVTRIGIGHYFTLAVSPSESGCAKPDPRMFDHVRACLAVQAENIVHVGDDPWYDVAAAHRAGIRSIWINREGLPWTEGEQPPDVELRDLAALPEVLQRMFRP